MSGPGGEVAQGARVLEELIDCCSLPEVLEDLQVVCRGRVEIDPSYGIAVYFLQGILDKIEEERERGRLEEGEEE
jgi:hypothetical protein